MNHSAAKRYLESFMPQTSNVSLSLNYFDEIDAGRRFIDSFLIFRKIPHLDVTSHGSTSLEMCVGHWGCNMTSTSMVVFS